MTRWIRSLVVPALDPAHLVALPGDPENRLVVLQGLVGGYVEAFHPCGEPCHTPPVPWHGFANEDGLPMGYRPNHRATRLAERAGWHEWAGSPLVGTIVFTGCAGEDTTALPDEIITIAADVGIHPK